MSIINELVTDRTAADVRNRTAKGVYNAADMNRVSEAVTYLRPIFREYGYAVDDAALRVWVENELPRLSEAEAFLAAVRDLDGHLVYASEMVVLPETMRMLTYGGANNIEKFLAEAYAAFERMAAGAYFAGEVYAGEV